MPRAAIKRATLILFAATAPVVRAGLVVDLVPDPRQVAYLQGDHVAVNVYVHQSPSSSPAALTALTLDFSSNFFGILPDFAFSLPNTDSGVRFWHLGPACGSQCYTVDDDLGQYFPYLLSFMLTPTTPLSDAIILPADGSRSLIGTLEATILPQKGVLTLDVLNQHPELGPGAAAHVQFLSSGDEAIWRAQAGQITGGTYRFAVGVPEPSSLLLVSAFRLLLLRKSASRLSSNKNCAIHPFR